MRGLDWRHWPLATRLVVLMTLTAMVPIALLTLYNDRRAREELTATAHRLNLARARSTAGILDAQLMETLADIRFVAGLADTVDFLIEPRDQDRRVEMADILRRQVGTHEHEAYCVTDAKGTVLLATDATKTGRSYLTASFFRKAIAGEVSFDEPRYDADEGRADIYFSAPVQSPRGTILGTVIGRMTMDAIDRIVASDTDLTGSGSFGVLWDELGIRISHGRQPAARFTPFSPLGADVEAKLVAESRFGPLTRSLLQGRSSGAGLVGRSRLLLYDDSVDPYLDVDEEGVGWTHVAVVPLRSQRWLYGVFTPHASLVSARDAQTRRALLVTLLAGLLALAAALAISRWVTGPLRDAVSAADAIASGDLTRRIGLNRRDEVGRVGAAFDHMVDALAAERARLEDEILERRRVEHEIVQLNEKLVSRASELAAANKELEAFAYSIAHDLRAPLRAMDGFSQILLQEHAVQLPAEVRRYLAMVRENAQRMDALVNGLLALSHVGRQTLKLERVALADLVHRALADLEHEQAGRQIELVIGDLPVCRVDPVLVTQVLVNLLSNALKFTRQREVARIEVGSRQAQSGEQVCFVRDNGVGFDMRYAKKLFGVFERLHGVQEYEGTGIGLAIVQRIIQRHGGRIWAESAVNEGATFFFTLPC